MNARGEAIIIGTVILIVIVLFSGGIVAYYTIKQAGSVETSCLEALNKVKFVDVGFSCRMSDAPNEMMLTSFSVKIVDDSIEGFNLGLEGAGSALPYEIKQGARHEPLCLLDNVFGGALVVPRPGDTLTYVAKGSIQKLFISPILKGGKNCYSEARSEIEISNECINPAVENRLAACLGSVVGAVCGDSIQQTGEACDDELFSVTDDTFYTVNPSDDDDGACVIDQQRTSSSCKNNICGDGYRNAATEPCDDGNIVDGDGCSKICRIEEVCGNSRIEQGEVCDPPNSGCNLGASETGGTCSFDCKTCNAPQEPDLGEALWNPTSATEGDTVEIRVDGTNVANLLVEMEVWEDDGLLGDDLITTTSATFNAFGSPIRKDYIATWQCDGGEIFGVCLWGEPEFYIKARLPNTAGSEIRSTNELNVSERNPTCGNNLLQAGETCDPPTTCTPLYGGTCSYCDNSCNYETLEGDICGDGILNLGYEVCDGNTFAGLGGQTCVSQGYAGGGTLGCLTDCSGFDFAQCVNSGAVCGNGNREAGEVCDDGNIITETSCTIYGNPGTFCNADCSQVITLSCPRCGDGEVQTGNGEQCDGNTQSCTTSGSGTSGLTGRATNENGVQTCSATCQWNTCTITPAV